MDEKQVKTVQLFGTHEFEVKREYEWERVSYEVQKIVGYTEDTKEVVTVPFLRLEIDRDETMRTRSYQLQWSDYLDFLQYVDLIKGLHRDAQMHFFATGASEEEGTRKEEETT